MLDNAFDLTCDYRPINEFLVSAAMHISSHLNRLDGPHNSPRTKELVQPRIREQQVTTHCSLQQRRGLA